MEMLLVILSVVMSVVAIFITTKNSKVVIENGTVKKENLVFKKDLGILSDRLEDVINQNKDLWSIHNKLNSRISSLELENLEYRNRINKLQEDVIMLKQENVDLKRRLETIEQLTQFSTVKKSFVTKIG